MLELYYKRCRDDFLGKYDDDFLYNFKKNMDAKVKIFSKQITVKDISDTFRIYFGTRYKIKKSSFRPKISKHLYVSPLHYAFRWNIAETNRTKKCPSMSTLDDAFTLTKNIICSINLSYKDAMTKNNYLQKGKELLDCIEDLNKIFLSNLW